MKAKLPNAGARPSIPYSKVKAHHENEKMNAPAADAMAKLLEFYQEFPDGTAEHPRFPHEESEFLYFRNMEYCKAQGFPQYPQVFAALRRLDVLVRSGDLPDSTGEKAQKFLKKVLGSAIDLEA